MATSASYQASLDGFAQAGIRQADAKQLIRRSVRLAEEARARFDDDQDRWIAGSVGLQYAALADGSEYRGDYDLVVDDLRAWHRPRIELLIEAGVDILALETIPCLAEVEALLAEIAGSGQPCWLSITCAGDRTRAGEPAVEAFALARAVAEIVAVGVNCIDPTDAYALVRSASEATRKPVVVYPNSGERWDATARAWVGQQDSRPRTSSTGSTAAPAWLVAAAVSGQRRSKRFVILFRHGPARRGRRLPDRQRERDERHAGHDHIDRQHNS